MIIVKLIGGLGNQMFQYAAGKALAVARNTGLKLDTSFLSQNAAGAYTMRKFELDVFKLQANYASNDDTKPFRANNRVVRRLLQRRLPGFFRHCYIAEKGNTFLKDFLNMPENTYLDGFWQNENYFKHIKPALIQDFSPASEIPGSVADCLAGIENVNSVSLHVRRGDYISNPSAAAFHGNIQASYYAASLERILQKEGRVEVFVFSDDIDWCKKNLELNAPLHFIEHGEHASWDIFLMSRCRHNIIANSSFSWWGAWLNINPGKIVMAPRYWFNNVPSKDTGIIAQGWEIQDNS